ncbi:MAG: 2-amino-4-hydroxy-6-hydroxymethyldihydropteridine diphosphokinase [Spirochaetales bacterium]|nr:2-amino-4-hydroxy-6-hydroxymethyldihydropteridine diphosphokinase [Spirochaetales bacterium]
MQVAVSLGGNLPQTLAAFQQARQLFKAHFTEASFSSLYRTTPQDDPEQPDFWNAVALGAWSGSADELLAVLLNWEKQMGRLRDPDRPKGPRILDLDLLLCENLLINTNSLCVPHPRMEKRAFVLIPLLELLPHALDPRSGTPWSVVLARLGDQGVVMAEKTW